MDDIASMPALQATVPLEEEPWVVLTAVSGSLHSRMTVLKMEIGTTSAEANLQTQFGGYRYEDLGFTLV